LDDRLERLVGVIAVIVGVNEDKKTQSAAAAAVVEGAAKICEAEVGSP
jgi:hypothetical protein